MAFKKKSILSIGLIFLAGFVFALLFETGLAYTNTEEFCTDCHTMQIPLNELKENIHYKNASGVRTTCSDCHVPKSFFPKMKAKIMAAKDVYHEILGTIDTPEKYEEHRWDMANIVWDKMKANDSRECRSCHSWESMDLSEQDKSARKRHGRAPDKGETCIDCHKGVAHEEPDEPDEEEEGEEEQEDEEKDAAKES